MTEPRDLQHQFYDMLLESERWSPAQLVAQQRHQLAGLLKHARAQVPFYGTRLDAVITTSGDIDWDRWRDIPIVTRADLAERRAMMQARHIPQGHGALYEATTTGSTGAPVTTTHNGLAGFATQAATFRSHRRHKLDWARTMGAWYDNASDPVAAPGGLLSGPWGPRWDAEAQKGRVARMNCYANAEQALAFYRRHDASYFTGRGKTAQALALEAQRLGSAQKFDAVLGFATGILPDEREDCGAIFGARMIGMYSSKEGHPMAHECPSGPHYHVNEETVLLEVIDSAGNPTPEGEIGRVVITPLYSTAQPLIRYEQGDLAVPGKPCACGRTLKVLDRIVGRTMHLFRFPDGSTIAPIIPGAARELIGARYWQVAQIAPLHIEVRYVPRTAGFRGDEAQLADIIRSRTHRDATVTFAAHETLVRSEGGKFIEYVNEIEASASRP